jgi:histidyl-tRNA synthetase
MELLPPQQIAFQRMLDTIRRGYERFGYLPVETPVFELTDVLLTKSGGDTEKQVYFVQSTGSLANGDKPDMALRFDLTVPLARYVAEHEHHLNFPFRRYQIQRVYRGERAQKGRYREFYQCDIDVIGKDTLPVAYDAEVPAIIYGIFQELALGKVTIKLNNRRLLRSLLESHGVAADKHGDVLHEVDRLGKMDRAEVEQRIAAISSGASAGKLLDQLTGPLSALPESEGRTELQTVYDRARSLGVPETALKIDLSIARGLDYYTGTVYETFLDGHERLGSICSGGRYDNLAEHYTKSKLPGVGISIGATRLFSQLLELGLVDTKASAVAQVLVLQVEAALAGEYARVAAELRAAGINVEVYGGEDKLGKQFKYADRAGIRFVIVLGEDEIAKGVVTVKDLRREDQFEVARGDLVKTLRVELEQAAAMG